MFTTSFWQLLRRCWCQTVMALLFIWIHQRRGEGGRAAWATDCPPYNSAQAYIHHHSPTTNARLHLLQSTNCHLWPRSQTVTSSTNTDCMEVLMGRVLIQSATDAHRCYLVKSVLCPVPLAFVIKPTLRQGCTTCWIFARQKSSPNLGRLIASGLSCTRLDGLSATCINGGKPAW